MQETPRYNLLSVLQKSLKSAQKKIYLHRIIYIANWTVVDGSQQESRAFNILIDSNIKLINEEYSEEIVTGFGIFYTGYLINIVEGPEETLVKHLRMLVDTLGENMQKTPDVDRMKVLLVCHHINKRYYSSWNGRQAIPPLLLDKIEPTNSPEVTCRHIQNCIMKLYRISEYLRNQTPNLLRATMDNISDLCRAYLPEFNLLDFLLQSPALLDLKEYIGMYGCVPEYTLYEERVWPVTSDFVPYNIIGEDASKKLMSKETDIMKRPSKDDDESFEMRSFTDRKSMSESKNSERKMTNERQSLTDRLSMLERKSISERKSHTDRNSLSDKKSVSYRKSLTVAYEPGEKKSFHDSHSVSEKKSLTDRQSFSRKSLTDRRSMSLHRSQEFKKDTE